MFLTSTIPAEVDHGQEETEARQEVLPFMRTYTGGLVSFWWHAADPAVIHLGDEGQLEVLALNFDEFLKGAVLGKSGVEDLDNAEPRLAVKGVTGKPSKAGLAALQKKFNAWWKANKSRQDAQTDLEGLRGRVMAVAEKMLADGLFKKLVPTQDNWKAEFRIQRTAKGPQNWAAKWSPISGRSKRIRIHADR